MNKKKFFIASILTGPILNQDTEARRESLSQVNKATREGWRRFNFPITQKICLILRSFFFFFFIGTYHHGEVTKVKGSFQGVFSFAALLHFTLWIILLSKPCRLLTSCIRSFIQQILECPLYTKPLRYITHTNILVLMEQICSRELPESLRAMLQMEQKDGHKWGTQKPVSARTHPHPCSSGLPGSSCLGVFLSDGQLLIPCPSLFPCHLLSEATVITLCNPQPSPPPKPNFFHNTYQFLPYNTNYFQWL